MKLTIAIDTDNAAFDDPAELPRVLRVLAELIELRGNSPRRVLRDVNGNKCGVALCAEYWALPLID